MAHTFVPLANKLKTQKFDIVLLKISECSVESNNCQLATNESENFTFTTQEINNDVNSENIQKQYKQKNLDQEKAKQKIYYLKQKRNESPEQKEKRLARNCEYKQIKKAAFRTKNNDSSEQNMESQIKYLSDTNRMNDVPLNQQDFSFEYKLWPEDFVVIKFNWLQFFPHMA